MRGGSLAAGLAALVGLASARGEEPGGDVRAVLGLCVRCHNPDERAGDLDLTTRETALEGGENGTVLRPGEAAASPLYRMAAAGKMPPKKRLAEEQVEVLKRWIDAGAPWEGPIAAVEAAPGGAEAASWALRPVARPALPDDPEGWSSHPIDRFVLEKLRAAGLEPAPGADRRTLIRRVTLDLTGLPPTPEEIDAFVADSSPDAYEKVVDRLLASPRYGERWGRHWLDVARFAESHGFEFDRLRDHAWRYRDYVIGAFNADLPYDRFIAEQIAGDAQEPPTRRGIEATGFLVAGPWDEAGNQSQSSVVMRKRMREDELEDMVGAVGQTFLGLTVNCARCHDHKFDPIPQDDYYRLKAALEGVQHGNRPALPAAELEARAARVAGLEADIARREAEIAAIEQPARAALWASKRAGEAIEGPATVARWTFEAGSDDEAGGLPGRLEGGAVVRDGRLRLDGRGAYLISGELGRDLGPRTLEAWVALSDLDQRGGGVVTIERSTEHLFDSITYAERQPRKWVSGSNGFRRTQDLATPPEDAAPGRLIHLAIAYGADHSIALYRDGEPYGEPYTPDGPESSLRAYRAGASRVLLGLRHTGSTNGSLAGEIEEARIYDRALSAEEVARSFRAGFGRIGEDELAAALPEPQRRRRVVLIVERERLRAERAGIPPVPLVYAANSKQPEPTRVLARGDVEKPKGEIAAGGLSAVRGPASDLGLTPDAPEGVRRRKLAEWIAHPDNPLTARVMANRVWHYHFGAGIVASPNDFGTNGERPSHPGLLDWLASEFVARGWSVKALHRLIVTSSTYRQSSRYDAGAAGRDAEGRLLWRFPPRRLEAEAIRDAMLAVAGRLNETPGGPSFRPFSITVFGSNLYTPTDPVGAEFDRRTVYRMGVNSGKAPLLEVLDCPDPSVKTPRRAVTTTPLQALGLMNDPFVWRQARAFAGRVEREAGGDAGRGVERAYRLALGRGPTDDEARAAADAELEVLCWALLNSSEFLYLR